MNCSRNHCLNPMKLNPYYGFYANKRKAENVFIAFLKSYGMVYMFAQIKGQSKWLNNGSQ